MTDKMTRKGGDSRQTTPHPKPATETTGPLWQFAPTETGDGWDNHGDIAALASERTEQRILFGEQTGPWTVEPAALPGTAFVMLLKPKVRALGPFTEPEARVVRNALNLKASRPEAQ